MGSELRGVKVAEFWMLDVAKYPLWVQKLLYYTIQHEGERHIDKCLYLRGRLQLTTARRFQLTCSRER